jgi:hypothetical protein
VIEMIPAEKLSEIEAKLVPAEVVAWSITKVDESQLLSLTIDIFRGSR